MPYMIVLMLLTGCNSLPAGDVSKLQQPAGHRGQVILFRGWRGLYSAGVDQLASEFRQHGIEASVFRETQWSEVADALIAHRPAGPIVIVGFSYGADNSIALARRLYEKRIGVILLITIDPVTPPGHVPMNVSVCKNFYRSNGACDALPYFRGVPLEAVSRSVTMLENIELHQHPELDSPGLGHRTIAASPKLHRAIVDLVRPMFTNP